MQKYAFLSGRALLLENTVSRDFRLLLVVKALNLVHSKISYGCITKSDSFSEMSTLFFHHFKSIRLNIRGIKHL